MCSNAYLVKPCYRVFYPVTKRSRTRSPCSRLSRIAAGYTIRIMNTTLQAWGNSQGIRLPKALLNALQLEAGSSLEIELSPKKDAIVLRPAKPVPRVRGRHRIEDLAARMPKNYKTTGCKWGASGREVW